MCKFRSLFIIVGALIVWGTAHAVVLSLNSPTLDFNAVSLGGPSDPAQDEGSEGKGLDIVGGYGGLMGFYAAYESGTTSTTGELFFRVRLGGSKKSTFDSFVNVGLDLDTDGTLDYFIQYAGKNPNRIQILDAGGTSPNTASIGSVLSTGESVSLWNGNGSPSASNNAFYTPVGTGITDVTFNASDPNLLSGATATDIDGNGDNDYFLTFSIDFSYLVSVVRDDAANLDASAGDFTLFDDSFAFGMLVATSQNKNNVNGDFAGIDGTATTGDEPFVNPDGSQGGGLSTPYKPDEAVFIPESSNYALIFGLFTLGFKACRRRRR